ncbi:hypothetical protein HMPREF3203_03763 [Proteus mirabilis]|nr:hypothetical protein HMPREF3203_03763 [Proteus mirabilis]
MAALGAIFLIIIRQYHTQIKHVNKIHLYIPIYASQLNAHRE